MSKLEQTVAFDLKGTFLGFATEESYKLKLIRVATPTGEHCIKLPKELRSMLYRTLRPGATVQVSGYQTFNPLKGKLKLKAEQVTLLNAGQTAQGSDLPVWVQQSVYSPVVPLQTLAAQSGSLASRAAKPKQKQETILVCQKSDCCKKGANALIAKLQNELEDRGLSEQIKVRGTGCMKQCKAGPNLVMPDKSRYTRLRSDQVTALIDEHFSEAQEMAS
jgi:(2Fe-2S) ferredoxin